ETQVRPEWQPVLQRVAASRRSETLSPFTLDASNGHLDAVVALDGNGVIGPLLLLRTDIGTDIAELFRTQQSQQLRHSAIEMVLIRREGDDVMFLSHLRGQQAVPKMPVKDGDHLAGKVLRGELKAGEVGEG